MPTLTQQDLARARTTESVLGLVRAYLVQLAPEDLARFPGGCLPRALEGADDLSELALSLARHRCERGEHDEAVVTVGLFIAAAAARLAQIQALEPHALRPRITHNPAAHA